ncbi:MAG: UvrD-helicase domain-containing protein, partial [Candidatus Obscuribacterales bacterium]|nr:UvrD-helicase domain-containing protein [Candidatus Obscuribacterales bacterium]
MTSNTGTIVNSDLLDRLNTEQKEAVCLKWGPSLIVAGAGSGKTTVLTRRVAYLLRELRQAPYTILGVTFTNKAAGEMRARLEALVGEQTAKKLTIGTFHSICARLLRNDIDAYTSPEGHKWSNNFVIYDETDTLSLVKDVIGKLNLDDKMYAPREMRNKISSFKNDGIDAATYSQGAKRYADEKFANIFSGYQAALARNNAMDF